MRFLVTAVPQRARLIPYLQQHIPNLEIVWDRKRDHTDTFLLACEQAGNDPVVRLEDDILLTRNFVHKITTVINEHPNDVIQFFSMRKKDLTVGSRWEPGASYMMNQCFYLPAGLSYKLIEYYWSPAWQDQFAADEPWGTDLMMAKMLQAEKMRYWLHVPSLVEHLVTKSQIDPRRSSRRQSKTFTDPELDGFPQ